MLFNSLDFAIFLPTVFALYWVLNGISFRVQNLLIVSASYFFYAWWDWRFLILIVLSTILDFSVGRKLSITTKESSRKRLLWTSILFNIGLLVYFKYYNFFIENFVSAFAFFGQEINVGTLNIILPVGISFYTFQTLSYSIDVYNRKLEPTKDFVAFSAFVSFFPQLVAGPIERASNFLPQFYNKRTFDYSNTIDGLRQILWGLFKKVVIADSCAIYVNKIFETPTEYSGSTLFLGAIFFAFQIYADFSGYSDIAIGTSRLFGFKLKKNFSFPYFSKDIAEFWRRWHISLSSWFRDYVYIPIGGSKGSNVQKIRNIFIVFLISGFWHGANWTFIAWGALNALLFLPLFFLKRERKHIREVKSNFLSPKVSEIIQIILTFIITVLLWVFFRADNISQAIIYVKGIFTLSFFSIPEVRPKVTIVLIIVFIITEWVGRNDEYAIERLGFSWNKWLRYIIYYIIIYSIYYFSFENDSQEFIYFQF